MMVRTHALPIPFCNIRMWLQMRPDWALAQAPSTLAWSQYHNHHWWGNTAPNLLTWSSLLPLWEWQVHEFSLKFGLQGDWLWVRRVKAVWVIPVIHLELCIFDHLRWAQVSASLTKEPWMNFPANRIFIYLSQTPNSAGDSGQKSSGVRSRRPTWNDQIWPKTSS